jgi:hypothetical protein
MNNYFQWFYSENKLDLPLKTLQFVARNNRIFFFLLNGCTQFIGTLKFQSQFVLTYDLKAGDSSLTTNQMKCTQFAGT